MDRSWREFGTRLLVDWWRVILVGLGFWIVVGLGLWWLLR